MINLDLTDPAYSEDRSHLFANLCKLSYGSEQDIISQTTNWFSGDMPTHFEKITGAPGIGGYILSWVMEKRCILVFRGTDAHDGIVTLMENLLTDSREEMNHIPYTDGKVWIHYGFWKAIQSCWLNVFSIIRNHSEVWITGHSLGGALAMLTAFKMLDVSLKIPKICGIYTFGCPRIGDRNFAETMDRNFPYNYRMVHGADPIPHLPPAKFLRDEHPYYQCGVLKYKLSYSLALYRLSGKIGAFLSRYGVYWLGDHNIKEYCKVL